MHLALKSAMSRIPYTNKVGETLSSITDPAAAYSLRALGGGDPMVARVRRSSDDAEKDFTASDMGAALEDWVNEDVVAYQSDFSSGIDGWSGVASTLTANIDNIDGQNDNLRVTVSTQNSGHRAAYPLLGSGEFTVTADVYIPSSNTDVDGLGIFVGNSPLIKQTSETDTWVTISKTDNGSSSQDIRIQAYKGNDFVFTGNGTDVYYIRNVKINQLTADGFVTTWYDQSGNSNDATQSVAASQPKIVDAGVLVGDGIEFDGVDDFFYTSCSLSSPYQLFFAGLINNVSKRQNFFDTSSWPRALASWRPDTSPDLLRLQSVTTPTGQLNYSNDGTFTNNVPFVLGFLLNGLNSEISKNGNILASGNAGSTSINGLRIAKDNQSIGEYCYSGSISEIIIYNSDQSANRAAIETNINNHYDIY